MRHSVARGVALLVVLALGPAGLAGTPHVRVVVADATYLMADTDTLSGAEENALIRAKRKAVEEVGVYIETSSQDSEMEVDGKTSWTNSLSLRTIAAAMTKTEILDKRRTLEGERLAFYVKIKVTVGLDALDEAIKRQQAFDQLAEHQRRLHTENSQLKAQLDELRNQIRASRMGSVASVPALQNHPMEIVGDYRYFYHDPMTAAEAKQLAYTEAIRMAIDNSRSFMDATAFITNTAFRHHLIQIIASGYLKDVKLVEQTEKNRTVYAKVRATMNPHEVISVVEREVGRSSEKEFLDLDPSQIHKLGRGQSEMFSIGPVRHAPLLLSLLAGLLGLLKLNHRNLPLFLDDGLGGLLQHPLGWENAADHDPVQSYRDALLLNQFGPDLLLDSLLQPRPGGWLRGQFKQRILLHLFADECPERLFDVILVPIEPIPGDQFRRTPLDHIGDQKRIEGDRRVLRRDDVEMLRVLERTDVHIDYFGGRGKEDAAGRGRNRFHPAVAEEEWLLD